VGREIRRTLALQVAFDETDMLGVAHNSVYFRWFERGRLELFEEILPIATAMEAGIAAPVVHNSCDYENPARFRDRLVLTTRMPFEEPYPGRIGFRHELSNARTKQPVARGETVVTLVEWQTGRLIRRIPEDMMERVRELVRGRKKEGA